MFASVVTWAIMTYDFLCKDPPKKNEPVEPGQITSNFIHSVLTIPMELDVSPGRKGVVPNQRAVANTMLDTGASSNVMTMDFLRRTGWIKLLTLDDEDEDNVISGFGSKRQEGYFYAYIILHGKKYKAGFHVVEAQLGSKSSGGKYHDVLLGMEFMRENGFIIDCEDGKVYANRPLKRKSSSD
eukprot:GHVP01036744.1.p1 GENE.GHVP01036744.1~~GHVP01036744.1.p1  ORF type:complete len:183 (-),score=24.61 GHVP01036744.1:48-596(-)